MARSKTRPKQLHDRCFVVMRSDGQMWTGRGFSPSLQAARLFRAQRPDAYLQAAAACARLRSRGQACAPFYFPPVPFRPSQERKSTQ